MAKNKVIRTLSAVVLSAVAIGFMLGATAYADNSLIELDSAIFEDITPYSNSDGIIYSESADGYYRVETDIVTFFSAVTGKESQVLTLSDGFINSVYSDERYVYLSYNLYTYGDTDETRIIKIDTLLGDTETIFTSDKYVTAVGVDDSGRLYLAANDEVIYIYSKDGNLLTQVTAPEIVYSFVGFDSNTGNFFFTGYYNWNDRFNAAAEAEASADALQEIGAEIYSIVFADDTLKTHDKTNPVPVTADIVRTVLRQVAGHG